MSSLPEWPLKLTVVDTAPLTAEIRTLILRSAGGGPLPEFSAGAHIVVQVAPDNRTDEAATVPKLNERSYSLINSTDQSGYYEIAVKLEAAGAGGSRFMHGLQPGDCIKAALPKNDFTLHAEPHDAVLIAGGIGITPILSMARALRASGRPFEMHYGARHPDLMAFQHEVMQASGAAAQLYFDQGPTAHAMNIAQILRAHDPQRHAYVCGPKPLLDAVRQIASDIGWPDHHVHFELFGVTAQVGDQPLTVVLQQSKRTLQVAATQSILDAMIEAGLDPMFDCKRGECGTCAVRVLSGAPNHRDYALSDSDREDDRLMCTCVSRCTSGTLVLDA